MDDATPPAPVLNLGAAPFRLARPDARTQPTSLICASPHSGRIYPAAMMAASLLDRRTIRRSEDAHVDELIAAAPGYGHTLLAAEFARAYIDVNREPWELDPAMFEDELPAFAKARTARVAAGLGAIARIVCEGQEIYSRKLAFAEAEERVRSVHAPYHAALAALIGETKARFGYAVLIDWHSMPAAAAWGRNGEGCDFVLGDRFGAACAGAVTGFVENALRQRGYRVARNAPYAGGYTTEHYGRPGRKVHALQIEINRALYFDEGELTLTDGFGRLKHDLDLLFAAIASQDWERTVSIDTLLTATTVMPFVPCDDFALCSRFYAEIGFEKGHDDGRLAVFRCGTAAFYLQNFKWPSAGQNYALQLSVDDVDAWWERLSAIDLAGKYGARAHPPKDEPWGARVLFLHDPTGVLWHISQRL